MTHAFDLYDERQENRQRIFLETADPAPAVSESILSKQ